MQTQKRCELMVQSSRSGDVVDVERLFTEVRPRMVSSHALAIALFTRRRTLVRCFGRDARNQNLKSKLKEICAWPIWHPSQGMHSRSRHHTQNQHHLLVPYSHSFNQMNLFKCSTNESHGFFFSLHLQPILQVASNDFMTLAYMYLL